MAREAIVKNSTMKHILIPVVFRILVTVINTSNSFLLVVGNCSV